jgi:uncharacterized membrane protein (UPF0127 family)
MNFTVINRDNSSVPLTLEVADTVSKREIGLMNRSYLPERNGMIFVYPKESNITIWMKNTEIHLDVLFIDSNGVINCIHHGIPHNLTTMSCPIPSKYVIELPYKTCENHSIVLGSRIIWSFE